MLLIDHFLYILLGLTITVSAQNDDDKEPERKKPNYNCLGGPLFGLDAACDFNNFKGLQNHNPSEILYKILEQSDMPNDTFYANGSHVTCLFADKSFILDFGAGAGSGAGQIGFDIDIPVPGTICVYVEDVPQGGLTLGEIKPLAKALIKECGKCGRMTVNYLSKNETQLGYLKFNWKDPAVCLKEDHCIDPAEDLETKNKTQAAANSTNDKDDKDSSASTMSGTGCSTYPFVLGLVMFWFTVL